MSWHWVQQDGVDHGSQADDDLCGREARVGAQVGRGGAGVGGTAVGR
ncbi:hypothetical protein ABZV31_20360 [Streptomyces sp. NPDC005202]